MEKGTRAISCLMKRKNKWKKRFKSREGRIVEWLAGEKGKKL